MENLSSKLEELKREYGLTVQKIIPLLPSLLAMQDFKQNPDIAVVRQRLKDGLYGTVEGDRFIAPKTGPYAGLLSDISSTDVELIKEIHAEEIRR